MAIDMLFMPALALFSLLFNLPAGHAWGDVGHKTVAAIAQNYLDPAAQVYVQERLLATETIVSVATWADSYRKTPQGKFSGAFHFIDAEDHPPDDCTVIYNRDCSDSSCIVSATKNYTQRILDPASTIGDQNEALKFLIHFLGDITQPLHDEGIAAGGNLINVTWNGQRKRLHGVWDDEMVNQDAGGNSSDVIADFAARLTDRIENDDFLPSNKADWVSCVDVTAPEKCALQWAVDANAWICEYVLKTDVNDKELNGTYYDGAWPIIELQLAKGGYRLGQYLNNLAASAALEEAPLQEL